MDMTDQGNPPGYPGIEPRWTSSAKSGVGTAASGQSRVWFTVSHGIINEVYYPRIDLANTRDLGFLVTDSAGFFSEEKRHTDHTIEMLAPGTPGFHLTNTCQQGRYRIEKTVLTDPTRDALLQRVTFTALTDTLADYHLYVLLAPHIGNMGFGNSGWVSDYKGVPMLFARRDDTFLALACSVPFLGMSCGYVGTSDGWQDLTKNGTMTWFYPDAEDGNIALMGEVDLSASSGEFVIALGFGGTMAEAGQRARAALLQDFETLQDDFVDGWSRFQAKCLDLEQRNPRNIDLYRVSTAVLKTHEEKRFSGGIIASLSIPWGAAKSDDDLGGYHLVWPRDLVETAGGLLAAGDIEDARQTLLYVMSIQDADGHWAQNMWLDGTPYWSGIQMDETAFPILLADALRRADALDSVDVWSMIYRAACFLIQNGPMTPQDRWEEDSGFSPFTLAVEIAALLAAADFADIQHQADLAAYLRETADCWNDQIERWTYVVNTDLAKQLGIEGYYVRIAPPEVSDAASLSEGHVSIKNRPLAESSAPLIHTVSPDALALVRFGLRAADDPRIANTVVAIDQLLKTETATGPVWHRYNFDGYGEHEDGSPFDGTGIGRGWPLLAGERAHYELALGHHAEAERLLHVLGNQCCIGGLIPEQIWDAPDLPDLELFNGHPAGSAMPLVWAHAEYIKLLRSLLDDSVFDTPPQTIRRYIAEKHPAPFVTWRFNMKRRTLPRDKALRIEVREAAHIVWTIDNWQTTQVSATVDSHLGVQYFDFTSNSLSTAKQFEFTFYWLEAEEWENQNYVVRVEDGA